MENQEVEGVEIRPSGPEDWTDSAVLSNGLAVVDCDMEQRVQLLRGRPVDAAEWVHVFADHFDLYQSAYFAVTKEEYRSIDAAHASSVQWFDEIFDEIREDVTIAQIRLEIDLIRGRAKTTVRKRDLPAYLEEDLGRARYELSRYRQDAGLPAPNPANRERVENFIKSIKASPEWRSLPNSPKLYKNLIWRMATYKDGRQFEHWQAGDLKATDADYRAFERILSYTPKTFVENLRLLKLIS